MKVHWFIFCSLLSVGQLVAQESRFKGSLSGGLTLSQIDGDLLSGFSQPGFHGGPQVNVILSKRWEWSLGLRFGQQGARRGNLDSRASVYETIRLNLVEVPVLLHFNEWKFQLDAGFAYGRVISSKVIDVNGLDITASQRLNDNILFIVLGGVYRFNDHWGFSSRWTRSLSNLRLSNADGTFIGRNLQFGFQYQF